MDGNTKQRYISTSIWDDDWFDSLSEREKLVYFYLLTNTHTNPAGVYQCTLKNIRLEIGLGREEIERIMSKFAAAGKAYCYQDYIVIPKWLKHQKIGERNKIYLGAVKILKSLPDDVKAFISDRRHYDFDVTEIIGSKNDGLSMAYQKNGSKNDGLSMAYAKNSENSAHDSDLDLDSDSDLDSDVVVDKTYISSREGKPPAGNLGAPNQPTTTNITKIQEMAAAQGFFLTDRQAGDFHCIDPTWLSGEHSFLAFAAEKIRGDPVCSKKPHSDQERIFAKGWSYRNWLRNYPAWLKKQAQAGKDRALELLRGTPPPVCPKCGADMSGATGCTECGGFVSFSEKEKAWKFFEKAGPASLSEEYKRLLKNMNNQGGMKGDEIDF